PLANPQERLLHEVRGVVGVAGQAVRDLVHEPPVLAGDLVPGRDTVGRHDNVRRRQPVPADATPRRRTGRPAGRYFALCSSFSWAPSSTPFLNSFDAWPSDRASLGRRVLPKRSRTTARMMRSSGTPMSIAGLSEGIRKRLPPIPRAGRLERADPGRARRGGQRVEIVDRRHLERNRTGAHDHRLDTQLVPRDELLRDLVDGPDEPAVAPTVERDAVEHAGRRRSTETVEARREIGVVLAAQR